jgi:hypothetical protein
MKKIEELNTLIKERDKKLIQCMNKDEVMSLCLYFIKGK